MATRKQATQVEIEHIWRAHKKTKHRRLAVVRLTPLGIRREEQAVKGLLSTGAVWDVAVRDHGALVYERSGIIVHPDDARAYARAFARTLETLR